MTGDPTPAPDWAVRAQLEGFARVDALHQPTTITEWTPCPDHRTTLVPGLQNCPMCASRPVRTCSNTTCCTWPCRDHLALHGETKETCTHG